MVKTSKLVLALLCLPLLHPAVSQTASLVMDVDPRPDAARASSFPGSLLAWKGKVFFAATEPGSGRELWISDGGATGTRLLADFCPGSCFSLPRLLGATRSAVLGLAYKGEYDLDDPYLWRSDGTPAGTFPLTIGGERIPVSDYEDFGIRTAFLKDVFYFSACVPGPGCELWRSDGTPGGTRIVRDLVPGGEGGHPYNLTVAGDRLFFTTDRTLWVSDGTETGTVPVTQIPYSVGRFAALGNKVLFVAGDSLSSGQELWVSDGTAAGTKEVTAFVPNDPFAQTHFLKALGGKVYFAADDVVHGAELWVSDGTAAGTKRVTEFGYFDPFFVDGSPFYEGAGLKSFELELLGNRLVFWATDGITGFQPWSSTGTPESTAPLCPGCSFSNPDRALVKVGDRLLFTGTDAAHGSELWASDGTPQGTALLQEACPGTCNGALSEPVPLLGAAFFGADAPGNGPVELWKSDGTAAGTRRFAAPGPYISQGSSPYVEFDVAALGQRLFYAAWSNAYGVEPWVSNGTPAGTRMVADIAGGTGSPEIDNLATDGARLYFKACIDYTARIWVSGGTPETTLQAPLPTWSCNDSLFRPTGAGGALFVVRREFDGAELLRIHPDGSHTLLTKLELEYSILEMVPLGDRLLFAVYPEPSEGPYEIWTSDGTPQGTVKALDLPLSVRGPSFLTPIGSEIWFLAYDENEEGGTEVWRTDGTPAGTRKAADCGTKRVVQDPDFTRLGSTVFFFGPDEDHHRQLWKTEGTPESAALVRDLDPEPGEYGREAAPSNLTAWNGAVYFFATTSEQARGLFRSDGTAAGTARVREFLADGYDYVSSYFFPESLVALGPSLLLAADDGVHGRELWKSDGTAAGTVLLKDVFPGPQGSGLSELRTAAGRLYFSAHDGRHGFELWRTDGTAEGTRLVQDLAPLGASSNPSQLTVVGDRLFFVADDGAFGRELWVLPLTGPVCPPSATTLCLGNGRFRAEVSWKDFSGRTGRGQATALTADTGTFWFFDPGNVEVIVKVLDGQGVNGHHWVFYGALSSVEYTLTVTDTATGLSRRYFNPAGQLASVGDTQGFGPLGAYSSTSVAALSPPPLIAATSSPAKAACVASATRLCLNGGRFAVESSWKDFSGRTGKGRAVALTPDTGYFWFFDAANVEVVAKVLDGRPVNGRFWLFYGALSNVEYTLTVTDTTTGKVKTYKNPSNRFASVGDTTAF
ncbi:MAG TPA: ELWxxDGT repeat protein [Thermoanaerobaculia bacterium]|nr:ELWxxDGT repeat protein [Thermoanaerobaculia bacterium]